MTASSTRRAQTLTTQAVRSGHGPQPPGVHPRLSCGQTSIRWHFQTAVRSGVVAAAASLGLPRWRFALHRGGSDYGAGCRVPGDEESRIGVLIARKCHLFEPLVAAQHTPAEIEGFWRRRSFHQDVHGELPEAELAKIERGAEKSHTAIPDCTHRSKICTRSGGHAPSHGIEPFFTRSKMSEAWARTSSKDQRSNAFSMDWRS